MVDVSGMFHHYISTTTASYIPNWNDESHKKKIAKLPKTMRLKNGHTVYLK